MTPAIPSPADKLCLGTAQFGLDYGVANRAGKPPMEAVFRILDTAWTGGLRWFDTAAAYGDAESRMGEWLATRSPQVAADVRMVSKLRPGVLDPADEPPAVVIEREVRASLARLRISHLAGFLLHRADDLTRPGVADALRQLKEMGLAERVGVSVYEPVDAMAAVASGAIDAIQVPCNVFDQRLDQAGFFPAAQTRGVTVFARSPFLQGLLCMRPEDVPPHLAMARPLLVDFRAIATRHGLAPEQAALGFVRHHPGINHVVLGVDTPEQLAAYLAPAQPTGAIPAACLDELRIRFASVPPEIVAPNRWPKAKTD
jgi:aryl-alcohol dehydrogenase-like predicted oxidoreductase